MSTIDIAWAAGIYEGEGSLVKDKRATATYNFTIKMTDLDVLQRFQSIFGVGSIRFQDNPSLKARPHWKPIWTYGVHNKVSIAKILTAILPYLGLRRAYVAQNCLDVYDGI